MRPVREVTAKEENMRLETFHQDATRKMQFVKRDPVEPEPIGTIILTAWRITGYRPDCDGSLMASIEHIDKDGKATGWTEHAIGLYPDTELVVTKKELKDLFKKAKP